MTSQKTVFYFGYGANMSKDYLQKRRRVFPSETFHGVLNGYKLVMNMEGPNFIEPSFANIMKSSNEKIEGILSKITEKELNQIINSEGVNYEIEDILVDVEDKKVRAKTLWLQFGIQHEEAKKISEEAKVQYIENKCIKQEYQKLFEKSHPVFPVLRN